MLNYVFTSVLAFSDKSDDFSNTFLLNVGILSDKYFTKVTLCNIATASPSPNLAVKALADYVFTRQGLGKL